jgi:two-component system sensor histidine kinase SenX3
MRRSVAKRLDAALARFEPNADSGTLTGETGSDVAERLERALERCGLRADLAELDAERLFAALHQLDQGVVICARDGTVVHRNGRAATFVGARHGEVLAQRALEQLLAGAVDGKVGEETIELFGPPRRTLTIKAAPLQRDGDLFGAVAVVDDITERRRLESMRRDFVANISHELKTPVGALGLVAETIEEEEDPEVIRRLSRRMKAEAERLAHIIEDLLDLSRIEADENPEREPLDVRPLVNQAVERVGPVAESRSIHVHINEASSPPTVLGDQRQLVSALHNLVENAVKYSDAGSEVSIEISSADDRCAEIAVIDHGLGIPSRDLERIFERFYRVDRARSRDTGGTGLGLSIVRHVATNHGGDVTVQSREGEGSTFTLRLPPAAHREGQGDG